MNKFRLIQLLEKTILIILFMLFSREHCLAADEVSLPDWVVDTICLSISDKIASADVYMDLYHDNNNKYYMNFGYLNNEQWINNWFDIKTHEVNENVSKDWIPTDAKRVINYDLFTSFRQISNTPYSCAIGYQFSNCDTPLNYWLRTSLEGKAVDNYMLIFSSQRKLKFKSGKDCWGMNGKMVINVTNRCLFPALWPMNDDLLLLGGSHMPYFIVIDTKKIDQAFKTTKTMVFNQRGVKGYWVKRLLVEQWIAEAERQFKEKKSKISLNEYVDQIITNKLSK